MTTSTSWLYPPPWERFMTWTFPAPGMSEPPKLLRMAFTEAANEA